MKNYVVTVNGVSYDVTVEEVTNGQTAAVNHPERVGQAVPKPAAAPSAAAPQKKAASGNDGSVKISAPMPGKIINIKKEAGAAVKKGEVVLVLEAMKMENEIVAPQEGKLASVNVSVGDSVEAGDVLASMN